jgi:hypothetical protein
MANLLFVMLLLYRNGAKKAIDDFDNISVIFLGKKSKKRCSGCTSFALV